MMKCIFSEYFVAGRECIYNYDCDICPTKQEIQMIITNILDKEGSDEKNSSIGTSEN